MELWGSRMIGAPLLSCKGCTLPCILHLLSSLRLRWMAHMAATQGGPTRLVCRESRVRVGTAKMARI